MHLHHREKGYDSHQRHSSFVRSPEEVFGYLVGLRGATYGKTHSVPTELPNPYEKER
jgi:hypothetical protein